jgi:hypothetical protein
MDFYDYKPDWVEYPDFKQIVNIFFSPLIGDRLIDIEGVVSNTQEWLSDYNIVLVFSSRAIAINTMKLCFWTINEWDLNWQGTSEMPNDFSKDRYLIKILSLDSILNKKLKNFVTHKQFKYYNEDFVDYEGILLDFGECILHIFDNGDELGLKVINGIEFDFLKSKIQT